MSELLHLDLESYSVADLRKVGGYRYAKDPTTGIWCAAYAFGDGPVEVWRPGQPVPIDIVDHVFSGGLLCAWNANFEMVMWENILAPRYDWPLPEIRQWRCAMTQALALALPGALENAAPAAGLDMLKDAAGKRLMLQMSRPRKLNPLTWWDSSDKIERLIAYCRQDLEVERELEKRLRPLKPSELDLWHLDQVINRRGVAVDVALCEAAKRVVADTVERLDKAMRDATDGEVRACSNVAQIVAWVRARGIDTESIAKDQVEEILGREDLPSEVREVLELRRQSAKTSVAKIDALLRGMCPDGRARGLLQFHAAGTGRWAGRRFQPQNLKRPDLEDVDSAIDLIMTGDAELVDMAYGAPLSVVADTVRGMIAAPPGRKIVAVDYANIEGRVLAWLAGEQWKLEAFRAFDEGTGPDLYKLAYANAFSMPIDFVTKGQRLIGKVMELALGYQGGVGAFQTMAVNYGVHLPDEEVEAIRDKFRSANSNIRQFWWDLDEAAMAAVAEPGATTYAGEHVLFRVVGSFLFMRLPSKRFLAYAYPKIARKVMPWKDDKGRPVEREAVCYMGVNSYTRKWERCWLYGGLSAENATQATARDILADAMPRLEAAGYHLILSVHDELVAEVDEHFGSVEEMAGIMTALPEWAEGLPVAAEGWSGRRYRK